MKSKKLKIVLITLLIFLVFLALNKFFYSDIKNIVFSISSSLQKFLWQEQNRISEIFESFFRLKELKIENRELKKENLFLKGKILELKELERENKNLREALDLELEKEFKLILVEIISQKGEGDFVLINKGKKDGVSENMPLITKEKVLVGRVGKVFNNFSQIILISNKNFSFSVEVVLPAARQAVPTGRQETEEGPVLGEAKGKGNFELQIELLPPDSPIEKGDIVITALLEGTFPENLLVGEIKDIKKSDVKPFQEGEIEPYFRQLNLETLFLIREEE